MLKQLPHRIKMNITLSIKKVFEQYMASIGWDEKNGSSPKDVLAPVMKVC